MAATRTVIVGLGNPLLGDDGIGWRVAEQVQRLLPDSGSSVEVDCLAVGGLRLMERLAGYDRAILIDAITTGQQPAGAVSCFPLENLPDLMADHLSSAHDTSLPTALKLGRLMGVGLPHMVTVVGVEAQCLLDFTEDLTPCVAAAVPRAAQLVIDLLKVEE